MISGSPVGEFRQTIDRPVRPRRHQATVRANLTACWSLLTRLAGNAPERICGAGRTAQRCWPARSISTVVATRCLRVASRLASLTQRANSLRCE
jgi:hypothetical protein